MKKCFIVLFVILINTSVFAGSYIDKQIKETKKNVKYESVQKHTANYNLNKQYSNIELKDPHLVSLSNAPLVGEKEYKNKITKDNGIYNSKIKTALGEDMKSVNVQPATVDFYNIYRITERLIRANKLGYVNWRIAIRKSEDEFNAATSSANYIYINTALYDTFYNNPDALAFVIGHEMGHQILGHEQRTAEIVKNINNFRGTTDSLTILTGMVVEKKYFADLRNMELAADAMGAELAYRAGYDMNKSMEALKFMNALPNVKSLNNTHPMTDKRIESLMEIRTTFPEEWINEGKYNIVKSEVLDVKKSSDRTSIVISQDNSKSEYYKPEDIKTRLTRVAYTSYKNRNMENAIKYFEKLDKNDYVNCLYISYANEYLYKQTNKEKYLTAAKEAIEKATAIAPEDKYVLEQKAALN